MSQVTSTTYRGTEATGPRCVYSDGITLDAAIALVVDANEGARVFKLAKSAAVVMEDGTTTYLLVGEISAESGVAISSADDILTRALIDAALARGFEIAVAYEGEVDLERCANADEIFAAARACDEIHLRIYRPGEAKRLGWFFLVFGNDGFDAIADYVDNDVCRTIHADVEPLIQRLEIAAEG